MLAFSGVDVERDGRSILAGIDRTLGERRIGVIGRNGSGKSTFARLANGLEAPTRGTVTAFGESERKALRRHVGFVFQNPDSQIVFPEVEEDIAFGLKALRLPPAERDARIAEVLDSLGLAALRGRLTHTLSGGEKQLVALAGVLAMRPQMIVLDEPTTLLDLPNTARLMRLLDRLDLALLLVTHDLGLLDAYERVLLFDGGRIVADGPPAATIAAYRALVGC